MSKLAAPSTGLLFRAEKKFATPFTLSPATSAGPRPTAYKRTTMLRRSAQHTASTMVAAAERALYDKQAKARQKAHGKTAPGKAKSLVDHCPQVIETGKAREQTGKAFGVSGKSVDHATPLPLVVWACPQPSRLRSSEPRWRAFSVNGSLLVGGGLVLGWGGWGLGRQLAAGFEEALALVVGEQGGGLLECLELTGDPAPLKLLSVE